MRHISIARILFYTTLLLPGAALAQQGFITDIEVVPDPACRNKQATILVHGTGSCQKIYLQVDAPNGPVEQITGADFPIAYPHTYGSVGSFTIQAGPAHAQCAGEVQHVLQVDPCGLIAATWHDHVIESFRPVITGGWGLVQPGNPFPIVVFGEKFGPNEGDLILEGAFGSIPLTILEWGTDGKFASAHIPGGICEVFDHEARIKVVTETGWTSHPWPVQFTAARETKLFPRSEVQVLACGDDSNKDCCNGQCDASDSDWFTACGSPNSGICGSHYNAWGEIGDDSGKDRYRVDLAAGAWVIEHWDFSVTVDPGEGWASLKNPHAYLEKVADFEIDWMVTPNDNIFYDVDVFMSGPCGTSHHAGVASSALTGVMDSLRAMAHTDAASARSLDQFGRIEHRVNASQLRRAAAQDLRAQQELEKRRAAVTDDAVKQAREDRAMRERVNRLVLAASSRDADAERIKQEADEILKRLERGKGSKE